MCGEAQPAGVLGSGDGVHFGFVIYPMSRRMGSRSGQRVILNSTRGTVHMCYTVYGTYIVHLFLPFSRGGGALGDFGAAGG